MRWRACTCATAYGLVVHPAPLQEQSGEPLQFKVQPPEQPVMRQEVVDWQVTVQSPPAQSSAQVPPVQVCEQSPPGHAMVHEPPVHVWMQLPCVHCIEHAAPLHVCEQSLSAHVDVQVAPVAQS
jgi:hypothetical protein